MDSISDAAPADVLFLLQERLYLVYLRRGDNLSMEVPISLAKATAGYRRMIKSLDNVTTIVICNPIVRKKVVQKEEGSEDDTKKQD